MTECVTYAVVMFLQSVMHLHALLRIQGTALVLCIILSGILKPSSRHHVLVLRGDLVQAWANRPLP